MPDLTVCHPAVAPLMHPYGYMLMYASAQRMNPMSAHLLNRPGLIAQPVRAHA